MRLALLLLALTSQPQKPFLLYADPDVTDGQIVSITEEIKEGWVLFERAIGGTKPPPAVLRTPFENEAHFVLRGPAETKDNVNIAEYLPDVSKIVVYTKKYGRYAKEHHPRFIAHELLHFYYGLPDEYSYVLLTDGTVAAAPQVSDCVMGNFVTYGWSGTLCQDCQNKVRSQRRR